MREYFSSHFNALVMVISFALAVLLPFAASRIDGKFLNGVGHGMETVLRNIVGSVMIVVIFVVMGMGIFFRYGTAQPAAVDERTGSGALCRTGIFHERDQHP